MLLRGLEASPRPTWDPKRSATHRDRMTKCIQGSKVGQRRCPLWSGESACLLPRNRSAAPHLRARDVTDRGFHPWPHSALRSQAHARACARALRFAAFVGLCSDATVTARLTSTVPDRHEMSAHLSRPHRHGRSFSHAWAQCSREVSYHLAGHAPRSHRRRSTRRAAVLHALLACPPPTMVHCRHANGFTTPASGARAPSLHRSNT